MFFKKEQKLNRQQKRERSKKIRKTISKIRTAHNYLSSGCNSLQARMHLRSLHGWHKELESLGVVPKQSLFQKLKSTWNGFRKLLPVLFIFLIATGCSSFGDKYKQSAKLCEKQMQDMGEYVSNEQLESIPDDNKYHLVLGRQVGYLKGCIEARLWQ